MKQQVTIRTQDEPTSMMFRDISIGSFFRSQASQTSLYYKIDDTSAMDLTSHNKVHVVATMYVIVPEKVTITMVI